MAQRTRKAAALSAAADPKQETNRQVKGGRGKSTAHAGPEPGKPREGAEEEVARKKILEEFNDREDLSERQLNNRNWL